MVVKSFWNSKRPVWFQKNDDKKLGQQYEDFILYGEKEELKEKLEKKGYNTKGASDKELQQMAKDDMMNKRTKRRFY